MNEREAALGCSFSFENRNRKYGQEKSDEMRGRKWSRVCSKSKGIANQNASRFASQP